MVVGDVTKWPKKFKEQDQPKSTATPTLIDNIGTTVGGAGEFLSSGVDVWESGKKLFDKDAKVTDRFIAGLETGTGAASMTRGGAKIASGAAGFLGKQGVQDFTSNMANWVAVGSQGLGAVTTTAKSIKEGYGAYQDYKTGKFKSESDGGKGRWAGLRSAGHGAKNLIDFSDKGAWMGKYLSSVGALSSGVGSVLGSVAGGLGAAVGTSDLISGGWRAYLAWKRNKALAGVQRGVNDPEQLKALKHLQEIQRKRRIKGGIDAALGVVGIASGALAASGPLAPIGFGLGAAVGATKLGMMGFRKFKQWRRDQAAKQIASGQSMSKFDRFFGVNATKSTDAKKAKDYHTASTILAMNKPEVLKTLGLVGDWDKNKSDTEKLQAIIEKMRKR